MSDEVTLDELYAHHYREVRMPEGTCTPDGTAFRFCLIGECGGPIKYYEPDAIRAERLRWAEEAEREAERYAERGNAWESSKDFAIADACSERAYALRAFAKRLREEVP